MASFDVCVYVSVKINHCYCSKSGFIPYALINFDKKNLTILFLEYNISYFYYGVGFYNTIISELIFFLFF